MGSVATTNTSLSATQLSAPDIAVAGSTAVSSEAPEIEDKLQVTAPAAATPVPLITVPRQRPITQIGSAHAGHGGQGGSSGRSREGYNPSIRSIEVDGQRFDLQGGPKNAPKNEPKAMPTP